MSITARSHIQPFTHLDLLKHGSLPWVQILTTIRAIHLCSSVVLATVVFAQEGQWTWMKGPSAPGNFGNFGSQGVASPTNVPPGLVNQFSWTGTDGTFWLYGGQNSIGDAMASLWKYDPANNMWTWMKGPSTVDFEGNFGIQGVESASNLPPAKTFGGASWVDLDGNFWMYGGENGDNYNQNANNDLWKYEPATNNWTWMKGVTADDPPAVWGTLGIPDVNNQPPARNNCYGTWVDNEGDLWMFGGVKGSQAMDDVWRYDIPTNTWTWMNGSQIAGAQADYGTLGLHAPGHTPGARLVNALGKDAEGRLYFQGGTLSGNGYGWGDLWRLDPATGYWAWMGGPTTSNPPVEFGDMCVTDAESQPGRRMTSPTWNTPDGRMWVFGLKSASGIPANNYIRSDLWVLCASTLEWTWVHGPEENNAMGVWGSLGVPSPANHPNGRSMASSWTSSNGELFLFGGQSNDPGFALYSDLWKFTPGDCGACLPTTVQVVEASGPRIIWSPADRSLLIMDPQANAYDMEIWDAMGRSVKIQNIRSNEPIPIDVAPGVYHIWVTDGKARVPTSIVIAD